MIRTKKHESLMTLVDQYAAAEAELESTEGSIAETRAAVKRSRDAREAVVKYLDDNFRPWSMPDLD